MQRLHHLSLSFFSECRHFVLYFRFAFAKTVGKPSPFLDKNTTLSLFQKLQGLITSNGSALSINYLKIPPKLFISTHFMDCYLTGDYKRSSFLVRKPSRTFAGDVCYRRNRHAKVQGVSAVSGMLSQKCRTFPQSADCCCKSAGRFRSQRNAVAKVRGVSAISGLLLQKCGNFRRSVEPCCQLTGREKSQIAVKFCRVIGLYRF